MRHATLAAIVVAAACSAAPMPVLAAPGLADEILALDQAWAQVAFGGLGSAAKSAALARLEAQAARLAARHPGAAEPLLWQGLIAAEQAAQASLFSKMGFARRSRDFLARAYALDRGAAGGAAARGLGVLYYKVPGPPIGFGDRDRARRFLREALAVDPDGLDNNYFQADFLFSQGNRTAARTYVQRALRAPQDPSRPLWDAARRREARALMAKLG